MARHRTLSTTLGAFVARFFQTLRNALIDTSNTEHLFHTLNAASKLMNGEESQ